uniref:Uncharacterized protein n=1 Tax=Opuntia streptacantha TaxID=393608 RepID=A0A7C8YTF8_OPUST
MGKLTYSHCFTSSRSFTGSTLSSISTSNSYATDCPTNTSLISNPDILNSAALKPNPFTIASFKSEMALEKGGLTPGEETTENEGATTKDKIKARRTQDAISI